MAALTVKELLATKGVLIGRPSRPVQEAWCRAEVWAHPSREGRVVVAGRDSDTVPVGTLGSIRRATGLEQLR